MHQNAMHTVSDGFLQFHGSMVLRFTGSTVLQFHAWFPGSPVIQFGSMVPWFSGSLSHSSLVPWFPGFPVLWFPGSLVLRFSGYTVPWFSGSTVFLVPWFPGSLALWFSFTLIIIQMSNRLLHSEARYIINWHIALWYNLLALMYLASECNMPTSNMPYFALWFL